MKIIDIGICLNNQDPKGIGRIRCVKYSDYIAEKERSINYTEWSDNDPFVALPFLPTNINFIPEKGQAVKIFNYNTEKETVNQEYVAGPFTTQFDYNGQTFSQQVENTSYGAVVKHRANIYDNNGNYLNSKSIGSFAKNNHQGIYGKYGSDILFTDNGVQLRGGKFLTKESTNSTDKITTISQPIRTEKTSILNLKKFPKKLIIQNQPVVQKFIDVANVRYLIQYDLDNLTSPTNVNLFVYKFVDTSKEIYKTDRFNEFTEINYSDLTLINKEKNDYSPTISISVGSIQDAYIEVRKTLYHLHEKNLQDIDPLLPADDLHPFYYKPTDEFKSRQPFNSTEQKNKQTFLGNVKPVGNSSENGLYWSVSSVNPTSKTTQTNQNVLIEDSSTLEQTFASLTSDKIVLMSTDTNKSDLQINFSTLDKYEYTQDDYLLNIVPNTYSTVRGENLIKILKLFARVLFDHRHPLENPMAKTDYDDYKNLVNLLLSMENDILNTSIRIN
jgi:hypothetical protein